MDLERKIGQKLIRSGKTLAIAESCTGGLLSNRLTNVPGSSQFLKLSIVAYSNAAKIKLLKVPKRLIRQNGAVSNQVAVALAKNVRKILKTDFGIGITGIAGPSGGSRLKPVGLTYIAVSTPFDTLCLECRFKGTRSFIKAQAVHQALRTLEEFLI
ncbi:MAG: hypothetical protein A3C36_04755 [Omnitrophica WOR_2 bacterium RIFCSPHIGHO2_02_FULL_52_10]|nr:MAG: hypothetical protein A3C36_04755 [Omnitrophica WOR_2 bacterium RIFCSPHIGHO2_02_FULL_52_10]